MTYIPETSDEYIMMGYGIKDVNLENVEYVNSFKLNPKGLYIFGYDYRIGPMNMFRLYILAQMDRDDNDIKYRWDEYGCKLTDYLSKVVGLNYAEVGTIFSVISTKKMYRLWDLTGYASKTKGVPALDKLLKYYLEGGM